MAVLPTMAMVVILVVVASSSGVKVPPGIVTAAYGKHP
jgi:hypothetical protein